jgi:hypothetical protein
MSGLPYLRIRFKGLGSGSGFENRGKDFESVMQLRSAAMAGKDDKKSGATVSAEGEPVAQKKTKNASSAANPGSIAEQQAFKAGFEAEFDKLPVATDKEQGNVRKGDKGEVRLDMDESLGTFPASQKIEVPKPTAKSKKLSKGEAIAVVNRMGEGIVGSSLENELEILSALLNPRGMWDSQVVVLPIGYLVQLPVKIGGVEVQPNSRIPSREGIDRIKVQFKANGYAREAAVMIGVLLVSLHSVCIGLVGTVLVVALQLCRKVF